MHETIQMPTACVPMNFTDSAIFETNNNTEEKMVQFYSLHWLKKKNILLHPDLR